jgi:hypothetical protein
MLLVIARDIIIIIIIINSNSSSSSSSSSSRVCLGFGGAISNITLIVTFISKLSLILI